ncbi:NADPH-dependent FMN reductase [Agrobacterium larrymoorei]|uniref:NAD(P)H-dependent oxidoreductase n=1 Tax=Agrobacterium larrymoorei TaxID=160699 RepID=A0A4D7E1F0_9HYPH|nr:NAD(P)H-dependent oxidoreductase [Agrobacterium larrymoorei]QCJ01055.1 NAD(P)H-dependent oxidoreductase [Agrobacterium larrymoorei]QYA10076.1 NAD(P)H-dependent oxidoreductase [Agrobacterium larrymoorei]
MHSTPKIALIIGSTRPSRMADIPAQWMLKQAQARGDIEVEVVDLRDHPLPFFDEFASNLWMPSQNQEAVRWQQTIGQYDGYIFVVAEYNHSITGVLKNALDQAYNEWNRKPFTAIGYGGTGATRAVEHLRGIAVELQMISTRSAVHIGGADFMAIHPQAGKQLIKTIEANLIPSATAALDELVWWAGATMTAKAKA